MAAATGTDTVATDDQSVSFSLTLVMMTSPCGVLMSGGLRISFVPDTSKNRSVSVATARRR